MTHRHAILKATRGQGCSNALRLRVKVVPNTSRSRVVGPLGDALKVTVATPPESGRANAAVCELIAEALEIKKSCVSLESGATQPNKVLRIEGLELAAALVKLGLDSA